MSWPDELSHMRGWAAVLRQVGVIFVMTIITIHSKEPVVQKIEIKST